MIVIHGEIHSSKNSRRIFRNQKTGRVFVSKSASAKADEETFAVQLAAQRAEWERMIAHLKFPLSIGFRFRRATHRRFDYANIVQGVQDAMVKCGYLPDDDAKHVLPVFFPYVLDKEDPGCDILSVTATAL